LASKMVSSVSATSKYNIIKEYYWPERKLNFMFGEQ
jgi:hypothetical protein